MSNELEEAMQRRAAEGRAMYSERAEELVAPARARVRRARATRALGTAGLAAIAVGAVTTVAIATGGRPTVAPATASPEPTTSATQSTVATDISGEALTAEDLLRESTTSPHAAAQIAWLCEPAAPRACAQVWIGQTWMLEIDPAATAVRVSGATGAAEVEWGFTNVSEAGLMVVAWATLPLIEPTWDITETAAAALEGLGFVDDGHATVLAAGATEQGFTEVALGSSSAVTPGTAIDLSTLVRVPFSDAADARELWLLANVGSTPVTASGDGAAASNAVLTAEGLREDAVARHREDYDRGSAQAGLDCALASRPNPRTDGDLDGQDAFNPVCDAVWLTDEAPLMTVTEATFDLDEVHDTVRVRWSARSSGALPVAVDTGAVTLAFEQPIEREPLNNGSITFTGDGAIFATSLWTSDTERHAVVRRASAIETVLPGQLISGEAEVSAAELGDLATVRLTLQIRVAAIDDTVGASELFLEMPWNGDAATSG
ncbi:hypothetical protein [Demequina mangrovi]|uniref:Uncharacterized protein n=1 Tax=Demequina mangrovi TaxID=1043493 RepID=A0A1H6XBT6_9MICO|nr:hypothetical protein [Demequina mangrovi]SEJ26598.1 hypothetical protein SAMN05421637_1380 [Demequina mangrovi]